MGKNWNSGLAFDNSLRGGEFLQQVELTDSDLHKSSSSIPPGTLAILARVGAAKRILLATVRVWPFLYIKTKTKETAHLTIRSRCLRKSGNFGQTSLNQRLTFF